MVKILKEKEFINAGVKGKISKIEFLKSLRDVESDENRIAIIFNEMKTIFAGMSNGLMLQGTGNVEAQRTTKQAMEAVVKAISDMTKKLSKSQQVSEWKFDVERDNFNNIVSLTARRVM